MKNCQRARKVAVKGARKTPMPDKKGVTNTSKPQQLPPQLQSTAVWVVEGCEGEEKVCFENNCWHAIRHTIQRANTRRSAGRSSCMEKGTLSSTTTSTV